MRSPNMAFGLLMRLSFQLRVGWLCCDRWRGSETVQEEYFLTGAVLSQIKTNSSITLTWVSRHITQPFPHGTDGSRWNYSDKTKHNLESTCVWSQHQTSKKSKQSWSHICLLSSSSYICHMSCTLFPPARINNTHTMHHPYNPIIAILRIPGSQNEERMPATI